MKATGKFEVSVKGDPPFETVEGVSFSRATFEKRFSGPLEATSVVQMLAVRTPVETSAGYVAVERIVGKLDGKQGTFALIHCATTAGGQNTMNLLIVPDSGTGALKGIAGKFEIRIEGGQHFYDFEYTLAG